jgi:hypothetical protein
MCWFEIIKLFANKNINKCTTDYAKIYAVEKMRLQLGRTQLIARVSLKLVKI